MSLVVVTASTDTDRARDCLDSWGAVQIVIVSQHGQPGAFSPPSAFGATLTHDRYLGAVPAFRIGVDFALEHTDASVIACLHDDLEIRDPAWASKVLRHFDQQPACGLAGFGGAIGLGSDDLYTTPYDPMHLARRGFRSNMANAEAHGTRSLLRERVACLDGFSMIGRRAFFLGVSGEEIRTRPWQLLEDIGCIHHAYDSAMGALAARYGWETWYLPIACQHFGGRTAVGDVGYQEWAKLQVEGGDHGFWIRSHRAVYDEFRAELPLRV